MYLNLAREPNYIGDSSFGWKLAAVILCHVLNRGLKKIRSKIRTRMPHHTPHPSAFSSVSARRSGSCVFKHFQTAVTLSQYDVPANSSHRDAPPVHVHVEKGEGEKCEGKQEPPAKEVLFTMNGEVWFATYAMRL